jgi:hypothetical protein
VLGDGGLSDHERCGGCKALDWSYQEFDLSHFQAYGELELTLMGKGQRRDGCLVVSLL